MPRFFIMLLVTFALCGCSCSQFYMQETVIVKDDDKYLSCQGIEYAMSEANVMLQNVAERCERPHIFTSYAPCTPWIKLDAARNQYIINDRLMYLKQLHDKKRCGNIMRYSMFGKNLAEKKIGCCGGEGVVKGVLPSN